MPSKRTIPYKSGTYFITFTCHQWLPLIEITKGYDIVYKWFDHLKSKGHYINGYVIMPNHIHFLGSFVETKQSINTIIGNGKRFMAYELVNRLKSGQEFTLLSKLANHVEASRRRNRKLHEVWEPSFDWKECRSRAFIRQKLDYIHQNPCSKKWQLCKSPDGYVHSSALFYLTGKQGLYKIVNVMEMEDTVFIRKFSVG